MIKAKVYTNTSGNILRLEVSGHAGFAEHGKDIVCAGVSALVQTAVLAIENFTTIRPDVVQREGFFKLDIPSNISDNESFKKCDIILKTTILGIGEIAKSYPANIVLQKKEVS